MLHGEKLVHAGSMDIVRQHISSLETQFDIFRFMKRQAELYRAPAFMVVNMPSSTSLTLAANTVITSWPAPLIASFDRRKLLSASLLFGRLRETSLPFTFDMEAAGETQESPLIRDLFTGYGLQRGASFPTHDSSGVRGAVIFSGDGPGFCLQQMMELHFLSVHIFAALARIREVTARTPDTLTVRETECLTWTAAGKTSAEIAEILTLSEHTVNHYLNRAARKLDAVNRTQAVAQALRRGLIE